mmetsp:Transcript_29416/g.39088  ORF Transcript_29416/g.39088 Transcript_29416/m.39088 type:complete len:207 (-) Transcript_29416:160-780(-)
MHRSTTESIGQMGRGQGVHDLLIVFLQVLFECRFSIGQIRILQKGFIGRSSRLVDRQQAMPQVHAKWQNPRIGRPIPHGVHAFRHHRQIDIGIPGRQTNDAFSEDCTRVFQRVKGCRFDPVFRFAAQQGLPLRIVQVYLEGRHDKGYMGWRGFRGKARNLEGHWILDNIFSQQKQVGMRKDPPHGLDSNVTEIGQVRKREPRRGFG